MADSPSEIIGAFVLEQLAASPTGKRVRVLRALAAIMPETTRAKRLLEIAQDLEDLDARQRELALDFGRPTGGPAR